MVDQILSTTESGTVTQKVSTLCVTFKVIKRNQKLSVLFSLETFFAIFSLLCITLLLFYVFFDLKVERFESGLYPLIIKS